MNINRKDDYLIHIEQAINDIIIYTENLTYDNFLKDKRTQQACIMNLIIIGEASTKLINEYPEFIERNPQISWKAMRGMRNRMAHGYFDIDLVIVWETIQKALPDLLLKITAIITQDD